MASNCVNRIFLIGFMGCGKTTMGRYFAEQLQWQWIDLDRFIENYCRKTVAQIIAEYGEDYFRAVERDILLEVASAELTVISAGGGTPCFHNNMALMKASGLTCYLRCSTDVLTERLAQSIDSRPLMRNLQGQPLQMHVAELLEQRKIFYEQADIIIDWEKNTFKDTHKIFSEIAQKPLSARSLS
ncbi:MAG: shikimate kinase [Prevotellaceae bacterium]|jgi:shikimate kinase|nr:shikimate kinase [Prevotellaceae bacterium]